MKIPFNIPYLSGNEVNYINDVIKIQRYSSAGKYNQLCEKELTGITQCKNVKMTGSATAALELSAVAIDLKEGDEVIVPSFTYVTSASAFVLRGAKLVFVDVNPNTMCLDETLLPKAITKKTKAIVLVHYGGNTSNIEQIVELCQKHKIFLIEDAAQSIDSYYNGKHLGTFGDFGCISFHDTKNIHCGEGGALLINNKSLSDKVDMIIEKGTNRKDFINGIEDVYTWKTLGSSFGLSEISAAFLFAQLKNVKLVTSKRKELYSEYETKLESLNTKGLLELTKSNESNNGHIFYVKVKDKAERSKLIEFLNKKGISAYFHYSPLHLSEMGRQYEFVKHEVDFTSLESNRLLRLPIFCDLTDEQLNIIIKAVQDYYLN